MSNELPDFSTILKQAQEMQQQLLAAQEEAAAVEIEGQAGGGSVRIVATGGLEFLRVHIDPSVVDPAEADLLEDLVLAALHDVVARASELSQQAMGGLDLGALGGLLPGQD